MRHQDHNKKITVIETKQQASSNHLNSIAEEMEEVGGQNAQL